MADDIVTRLRNSCAHNTGDPQRCTRCGRENAYAVGVDAVEYIRAQQAEIERLRCAGNALAAKVLEVHQPFLNDENIDLWWSVCNWEEARRG